MITCKIEEEDSDNPILGIEVGCKRYSFSLAPVDKGRRHWMKVVIERTIGEIAKESYLQGQQSITQPIRAALGIK